MVASATARPHRDVGAKSLLEELVVQCQLLNSVGTSATATAQGNIQAFISPLPAPLSVRRTPPTTPRNTNVPLWRRSQAWPATSTPRASTSAGCNGSSPDASSAAVKKFGSAETSASISKCRRAAARQERTLPGVCDDAVSSIRVEEQVESSVSAPPSPRLAYVNTPRPGSSILVPSSSSTFGARMQADSGATALQALAPLMQASEQEGFMVPTLGTSGECNSSTDMETGSWSSSEGTESWRSFRVSKLSLLRVSKGTESTRSGSSIATDDSPS